MVRPRFPVPGTGPGGRVRPRCQCGRLDAARVTAQTPRGAEHLCGPCRAKVLRAAERRARALADLDALGALLGWAAVIDHASFRAAQHEASGVEGTAVCVASSASGVFALPEAFR